jgi:hypothetical protein
VAAPFQGMYRIETSWIVRNGSRSTDRPTRRPGGFSHLNPSNFGRGVEWGAADE